MKCTCRSSCHIRMQLRVLVSLIKAIILPVLVIMLGICKSFLNSKMTKWLRRRVLHITKAIPTCWLIIVTLICQLVSTIQRKLEIVIKYFQIRRHLRVHRIPYSQGRRPLRSFLILRINNKPKLTAGSRGKHFQIYRKFKMVRVYFLLNLSFFVF